MKNVIKKVFVTLVFLTVSVISAVAQCAMCRATIENNVSNGDVGIGASLNFGILYLFVMPYLAISVVGYLWYRNSKANAKQVQRKRNIAW